MIEFYFGYRMKITDVDDIYFSKKIINNRFEYSISLKFNFKKIWQKNFQIFFQINKTLTKKNILEKSSVYIKAIRCVLNKKLKHIQGVLI